MKLNTKVWLGIRNVGDAAHSDAARESIEQLTVAQALHRIMEFVKDSSMATRFQFTFARSHDDALRGLGYTARAEGGDRTTAGQGDLAWDSLLGGLASLAVADEVSHDSE